ncbi:DUF1056 family protein [Streptococcus anginosus]
MLLLSCILFLSGLISELIEERRNNAN